MFITFDKDMRSIITLISLCLSLHAFSQSGYTRTYGAYGLFSEAADIAIDTSGNVFLCGSTGGWGAVNGDMAVVKTDTNGIRLWEKVYGSQFTESGKAIVIIPEGGFIALGTVNSGSNNDYELLLVRADENGDEVWQKVIGGSGWDQAADLTLLSDGGFAVASTQWDDEVSGQKTMVCRKFDSEGNQIWEVRPDNELGFSEAYSILELRDSTILIAGTGNLDNLDKDMLLVKYSYEGNEIWKRFYGVDIDEWIAGIALTADDRIGVAGNRQIDDVNKSPHLLSLNTDGDILNEFFEPNNAETTGVAFNPLSNSYFFAWNYTNSGTNKAAIFNFTNDFIFGCNGLPSAGVTVPFSASSVAVGLNGYMMLCGKMEDTGPGIISMLSFKCNPSCQHDQTLQVSLKEVSLVDELIIYPNPASAVVNIDNVPANEIKSISLIDLSGKQIQVSINKAFENITFDISNIHAGFYLIQLELEKSTNGNFLRRYPIIIAR
ncbi:MAG: T9SS type A sorting domain-containing protein [Bacteroidia bacterium]